MKPASDSAGETFGRYRLLQKIATGGMGEIFLARLEGEAGFEKLVVLKRLLPELVASEEFRQLFLNEARIAAQLSHNNICDIYELGQVGDQYFIAMQYLQGVPLSRLAEPGGPTGSDHVRMVVGLGEQACAGLHHAHQLTDGSGEPYGLVHRDVSPSNLLVSFDGVLKLLDFGIAKAQGSPSMTSKNSVRGKLSYMSPEQIRGDEIDRRSDIFSLAVVLLEALTRRRMFARPSQFLVAKAILEETYPHARERNPDVPEALDQVLARALARRPADRFADARELGAALREAAISIGGAMAPTEIGERLRELHAGERDRQEQQYREATSTIVTPDSNVRQTDAVSRASRQSESPPIRQTESVSRPSPVAGPAAADRTPPTRNARPGAVPIAEPPAAPARRRSRWWDLSALLLVAGVVAVWMLLGRGQDPTPTAGGGTGADAGLEAAEGAANPERPPGDQPEPRPDSAETEPVPRSDRPREPDPRAADDADPPKTSHPKARPRPRRDRPPPPPRDGYLSIDSNPYATIYVDGDELGPTPIIGAELPAGRHRIRAVLEDGRSRTFDVRIRAERTVKRTLDW